MNNRIINNLQSPHSYQEYVEMYLKDSLSPLANAGQRFGINANGVKYINKTCAEIFDLNNYSNKDELMLELNIGQNSIQNINIINVNKKSNNIEHLSNKNIEFDTQLSINDIFESNGESLHNLINFSFSDIGSLSNDSYIIVNNKLFTGFIKGDLMENNNSKLIYFQYDISQNKLLHYIVTKPYNNKLNNYNDWYIVYKLDFNTTTNQYDLTIYLYRLEWLISCICENYAVENDENSLVYYSNLINSIYKFNDNVSIKNIELSFFNNDFEDYNCFTYNGANIDKISFLNFIFNYDYTNITSNDIYKFKTISINYENNQFDTDNIYRSSYDIVGYISKDELTLFFINLQNINIIYNQFLLQYNKKTFFNTNDNSYIYKYILYQLFVYLRNYYEIEDGDKLYIPLTYTFNCFINDINTANLYYIDYIYVNFCNDNDFSYALKNQIYYYHKYLTNHISIYRININYNEQSEFIINNVLINKLYTLPYLNRLKNWVIDDVDIVSPINKNEFSGIKELYIYNNIVDNNEINVEILNFSDSSINRYINKYDTKEFIVNPKYFVKFNEINVKCKVKIPNMTNASNDIIDFFKNTIIIAICNKTLLNNIYIDDYKLDYIYSLWKYDEQKNEFVLITLNNEKTIDNNNIAFDPFNNESFVNTEQTYKYIQSLSTSNKFDIDQSTTIEEPICVVMRNKHGSQYNSQYNNNYNAIIEYIPESDIKDNGNNPNYSSNKYINDISNVQLTNTIYPRTDIVYQYQPETHLLSYNKDTLIHNLYTRIRITISGTNNEIYNEILTEENIKTVQNRIDEYVTQYSNIEVALEQESYNNQNDINSTHYLEYVFNENVPTIDFKEVFLRNINTLNRVNILGLSTTNDNVTNIYNGYIGTNYNANKNTLYISTDNNNINIGNDTLLKDTQNHKFNKYDTFQIDGFENINLLSNNTNKINITPSKTTIANDYIELESNNPITFNKLHTKSNVIIKSENIITNITHPNVNIYTTSIIPHGNLNTCIYISYDYNNHNNLIINALSNINDNVSHSYLPIHGNIATSLFIPIYGLYTTRYKYPISYLTDKPKLSVNSYYFYNSINLTLLLHSLFGETIFEKSDGTYYPIIYKCNFNNKILTITNIDGTTYDLLIFNDNDVEENPTNLQQSYKVFNHILNITLQEPITNDVNKTLTIYINFENTNIEQLNKQIYNTYNDGVGTFHPIEQFNIGTNGSIIEIINKYNSYLTDENSPITLTMQNIQ